MNNTIFFTKYKIKFFVKSYFRKLKFHNLAVYYFAGVFFLNQYYPKSNKKFNNENRIMKKDNKS